MDLYQPEKYKVHLGKGSSIGFCTVWNEPEVIFNRSAAIKDNVAILGTLYSRQGVNIILRNLALNPAIRKFFIWGSGTLSNTNFGLVGSSIMKKIWDDGIDKDGKVKGTDFTIEPEIDPDVIEKIVKNVEFIDVSKKSFGEVEAEIKKSNKKEKPYMESKRFPDHVSKSVDVFPSEEVGWLVRDKYIMNAWSRVVERIMRYGLIKGTQYGYKQRELIGLNWVISNEDPVNPNLSFAENWPENLKQVVGASKESIKEYHKVFLSPESPEGIHYTYGNRMMQYPEAENMKLDQIEEVIKKQLRESPDSRRAVATTMVPLFDKYSKEPPCITQIQCLQTNGNMHLLANVRSHDIFKAAVPNAFGLRILQKTIADDLGFGLGQLQINSQSAHIYEQDWDDAFKLSECQYWERKPDLVFNPETQNDPRGVVLINISNNKINAIFQNKSNEEFLRLSGKSAKEVGMTIAKLELLSRTDHMMDLAMELQKAEIALKQKLVYKQDQPLKF